MRVYGLIRVYPCNFIKNGFQYRGFPYGFCKIILFKISENFLTKLQASNLYVATTFHWNADDDTEIPMPRFLNGC